MRRVFLFGLLVLASVAPLSATTIRKEEFDQQKEAFKRWWEDDLVLKLTDLPTEGGVPEFRVPYAGHDYPDKIGGTIRAMSKYDQAFHGGQQLATSWEREDVSFHRNARGRTAYDGATWVVWTDARRPVGSGLVRPLQRLDGGDDSPCGAAEFRGA